MKLRSRTRFLLEGLEGAALMGAALCTWPISRRWLANWGTESAEQARTWSGDDLAEGPLEAHTRAVHVAAPADAVWRWLVQFGMGRAGFYSYELLERIAGIPVRNIESIEPNMQSLEVGDEVLLHPKAPGIRVSLVETGQTICFGADPTVPDQDRSRSWSMYIVPITEDSCRLLVRSCLTAPYEQPLARRVALALEQPIDFVMEQRMLRTIKRLAEVS